jgi:hypothetical protein
LWKYRQAGHYKQIQQGSQDALLDRAAEALDHLSWHHAYHCEGCNKAAEVLAEIKEARK